mmetsp:Transcript_22583/g.40653  ORF Transcript_22583/g.40653 Transcript_22583/m.40653 type:complete len:325 (+) Transcript_22583:374-1348(+)
MDWAGFQGTALGFFSALIYILKQDFVLKWTEPARARTAAVFGALPMCVIKVRSIQALRTAAVAQLLSGVLYEVLKKAGWITLKQYFVLLGVETWVLAADMLLNELINSIFAKPILLDDLNAIEEQLCISGLKTDDIDVQFLCYRDLLRVACRDEMRRYSILKNEDQEKTLFESGLRYMYRLLENIRNKEAMWKDSSEYRLSPSLHQYIYFVFNDSFEHFFRDKLYSYFAIVSTASATLTYFIVNDTPGVSFKQSYLKRLVEMQLEIIVDLSEYLKSDPQLRISELLPQIIDNLIDLHKKRKISDISVKNEKLRNVLNSIVAKAS